MERATIFQIIIMELFQDLDFVLVYINDILILQQQGETEDKYLHKIDTVLSRLETAEFQVNLRKLFFNAERSGISRIFVNKRGC